MTLFEQDFLMRQIQQLTQLLQEIIFKKSQNQHQEAFEEIHNAFQRLTKDHPKKFNELTLKETTEIFKDGDQFQAELAVSVADLLVEEGEIREDQSFSASQKSYAQALLLYKTSLRDEDAAVPIDFRQKINKLKNHLEHSDYLKRVNQILGDGQ